MRLLFHIIRHEGTVIYRLIAPDWLTATAKVPKVLEGEFTDEEVAKRNEEGYNAYFLPNYPSHYTKGIVVEGSHIDQFRYVFVDFDLKHGAYLSKADFIMELSTFCLPTKIVDSGNGVHVYWRVSDLNPMSFLRLQRRLQKFFKTDEAVAKIYQLMRVPGTFNTKVQDNFKLCEVLDHSDAMYTCEELDSKLPPISKADEDYCQQHYNKTYNLFTTDIKVSETLPLKFCQLLKSNAEIRELWVGETDDRSKSDYRIGHIMFGNGFTKDEAMSVLVNAAKALSRAPVHRVNYAKDIVDKIWTYELTNDSSRLSSSVKDILAKKGDMLKGKRFPCWTYLDATHHGFRLGQVIGLVAGSGVGKTAVALNMFMGFVKHNPDYHHFFVPLEQPDVEIADRWRTMCAGNEALYEKVHVISNYAEDGSFRHLSFDDIKQHILQFQTDNEKKVGCVVIDHIGALKKKGKEGENQDLMTICHEMKAFAVATNTMLVMQSQSSREKAGIGDLELNKDAAYGTVYFESYCDYLITIWQPLKAVYSRDGCPTVTSFKFCKIRHKKAALDAIKEDVCYNLYFDSATEHLREMTQQEQHSFDFFAVQALNKRKKDKKTDLVKYETITWTKTGATKDGTNNSTNLN